MPKKKRRRFTGKDKIQILKKHLLEGEAVSSVCKTEGISPAQFYQWQKLLFEGGEAVFETKKTRASQLDARDQKIQELEQKLAHKNEVLSEAVEALVTAKKHSGDR